MFFLLTRIFAYTHIFEVSKRRVSAYQKDKAAGKARSVPVSAYLAGEVCGVSGIPISSSKATRASSLRTRDITDSRRSVSSFGSRGSATGLRSLHFRGLALYQSAAKAVIDSSICVRIRCRRDDSPPPPNKVEVVHRVVRTTRCPFAALMAAFSPQAQGN